MPVHRMNPAVVFKKVAICYETLLEFWLLKHKGGGCVFVAALLHYLALSSMMWMAVEARNMYVSTVKVFPEDTPRYMLKACLIAWGKFLEMSFSNSFKFESYFCFY